MTTKIIAAGYSNKKLHWQNIKRHGVQTACHKKTSFGNENDESFYKVTKNYPELCCQNCLNKFNMYIEKYNIKINVVKP